MHVCSCPPRLCSMPAHICHHKLGVAPAPSRHERRTVATLPASPATAGCCCCCCHCCWSINLTSSSSAGANRTNVESCHTHPPASLCVVTFGNAFLPTIGWKARASLSRRASSAAKGRISSLATCIVTIEILDKRSKVHPSAFI